MPRVSYIKAMDIYLGACFIFVFLSLIKLAILKMMRLHGERREWRAFRHSSTRRSLRRPYGSRYRSRDRYDPLDREQYLRRTHWAYSDAELDHCVDDDDDPDAFQTINRAYLRNKSTAAPCSIDLTPSTTASTPTGQLAHQNHVPVPVVPTTALSTPRLGKTSSRVTLLYSQLSLDASERYRKPGSSPAKKSRPQPNSNGITKGGRTGRFADLFAINAGSKRFASTDTLTNGQARFRKMYKKVWIILFPLSFVGFCIFYFISYFVMSEDKTMTKCQF